MSETGTRQTRNSIASGATASVKLPPHEWNFADVLADEKEACYLYEYAREFFKRSKHLKNFLKEWNDPAKKGSGQNLMALQKAWDLLRTRCENFPYIFFGNFPKMAWQDLPEKRSGGRRTINLRRELADEVNGWSKRQRKSSSDRIHIETLRQCEPPNIRTVEAFQEYHKFFHEVLAKQDLSKTEYGFFAINWKHSRNEIIVAFTHWLETQLKERKQLGLPDRKSVSNRGGFKDRLNWLGALRLKSHYRKKDLVDHANTYLKCKEWPYRHFPDLCKAANKAETEIQNLFSNDWNEAAWRRKRRKTDSVRVSFSLPESLK